MQKLVDILADFFNIGDSYHYTLGRDKEAFAIGTMGLDDFKEYTEETVEEIAAHLIANGVTVQRWIPLKERMPTKDDASEDGEVLAVWIGGRVQSPVNPSCGGVCSQQWGFVAGHPEYFSHWVPFPQTPGKEVQE